MSRFAQPVWTALALLGGCLVTSSPLARDYGRHGTVWPVIEPDLLAQIRARLTALEASGATARLQHELQRKTIARVNRPSPVAGLTVATEFRVRRFDPTITVERDLTDDRGRIIVAAGTRVNPLDTVGLRQPLVFLDGDDPAQVAWATTRFGSAAAKLILVNGAPLELMKANKRRFYFDQNGTLVKHFAIAHVPTIVAQHGRVLTITEQPLPRGARAPS